MLNEKSIVVYPVHINADRPPLGLGMIITQVKKVFREYNGVKLEFPHGYIITEEELKECIEKTGSGIFIFSNYIWNVDIHGRVSKEIKEKYPDAFIMHGGPCIPRAEELAIEYMKNNPAIDAISHGEGEITCCKLIEHHLEGKGFEDILGITYRKGDEIIQTSPNTYVADLSELDSPFLTGEFDSFLEKFDTQVVCLETSRGCPNTCAFCDWGQATRSKIREFPMEKVYAELEWVGTHKIPVIEMTDSNFGILERDLDVAKYMCKMKVEYGFPKELCSNFAKNTHKNLLEIIQRTKDVGLVSQAILSMQTLNSDVLEVINRRNLNAEHYDKILAKFREMNLPVTAEFMISLPNATKQSSMEDLQWACERNMGVYAHSTLMLVNTLISSKEYRERFKMKKACETRFNDPEFLRSIGLNTIKKDTVVETSTMSQEQYIELLKVVSCFHIFYGESILKYVMFYLKNDHSIRQIDFLDKLSREDLTKYPYLRLVRDMGDVASSTIIFEGSEDVLWDFMLNNKWKLLYDDVHQYVIDEYGIDDDVTDCVFEIQRDLMAYSGKEAPVERHYPYNFAQYFNDIMAGEKPRKLSTYPPFELKLTDPLHMCIKKQKPEFYEPHHGHIELASQINSMRFGFDLNDLKE